MGFLQTNPWDWKIKDTLLAKVHAPLLLTTFRAVCDGLKKAEKTVEPSHKKQQEEFKLYSMCICTKDNH